jgi:hypothetical protein
MPAVAAFLAAALASPGATVPGGTPPPGGDIRAIVPPQPYAFGSHPWFLVVTGVCVILAALVAWYLIFRPAAVPPLPVVSPRDQAERRLRELADRADTLDARAFGNEVADVLRVYLGRQFNLHPERQTSQEFLGAMAGSRAFTRAEHDLLTDFLTGCDLLKFARADATSARKQALVAQAADFVRTSAPPPLPPGLPPATTPPKRLAASTAQGPRAEA